MEIESSDVEFLIAALFRDSSYQEVAHESDLYDCFSGQKLIRYNTTKEICMALQAQGEDM